MRRERSWKHFLCMLTGSPPLGGGISDFPFRRRTCSFYTENEVRAGKLTAGPGRARPPESDLGGASARTARSPARGPSSAVRTGPACSSARIDFSILQRRA